jgi:hypothetical protein
VNTPRRTPLEAAGGGEAAGGEDEVFVAPACAGSTGGADEVFVAPAYAGSTGGAGGAAAGRPRPRMLCFIA